MEWFKFYGKDFLSDVKLKKLSVTHRLMWVYLLCRASERDDGYVTFVTQATLREDCGLYPNMPNDGEKYADGFFEKIEKLQMIEWIDDDTLYIKNYVKRQNTQLTAAERQKRYREKQKQRNDRNAGNVTDVTLDKSRVDKSRKEKNTTGAKAPGEPGTKKKKSKYGSETYSDKKIEEFAQAFVQRWNKIHGRQFKAWKPICKNLAYWMDQYPAEDILQAMKNVKADRFWKDKMTPVMFLRRKNPNGEEVDYISQLLNAHGKQENQPTASKIIWD